VGTRETARYWTHPAIPEVDLLSATYVRHTFGRHTHETYVVAAITSGVEVFDYRGTEVRVGAGEVALVNPDMVHTGQAGVPGGWTYRVLYPSVPFVGAIAEELGTPRGTPGFPDAVIGDAEASRLVQLVHLAAERNQALAADTHLRLLVARLLRAYARPAGDGPRRSAGTRAAARARDLLLARMDAPPALDELAAAVDARPFPLLRAFRDAYGLPPHAWLTEQRVRRAQRLLAAGVPAAEAAVDVGFTDQSHLTRHFRRIVGVPPGAYGRGRKNVQEARPVGLSPSRNEHH
jgi:AraC-like DNA-binding protein